MCHKLKLYLRFNSPHRLQDEQLRVSMGDWIVVGTSLLLMFLDQTTSVEPHCRTVKSISNRALHGHVIAVAQTFSLERCSFKCERKVDCYSINYMLTSNSCELNKGTRLSHPKHFLPRENTVYIDNLHRRYHVCVHPPCQNGGTCVALAESPGYKCLCQSNYSGDDCQGKKIVSQNMIHFKPDCCYHSLYREPSNLRKLIQER